MASAKIYIQDSPITILTIDKEDYISLTDMAHSQLQEHIIFKWMSLKNTIEYPGEWEALYNPNFNYTEFGTIRNMAGSNKKQKDTNQITNPLKLLITNHL